jgi:hypothetical protein
MHLPPVHKGPAAIFFAQRTVGMHDSAHQDGSQHGGIVVDGNNIGVVLAR